MCFSLLTRFEVALFDFKGNALAVCLAQPNGLGNKTYTNLRANGPIICLKTKARLGKWADLRPETEQKAQLQKLRVG